MDFSEAGAVAWLRDTTFWISSPYLFFPVPRSAKILLSP